MSQPNEITIGPIGKSEGGMTPLAFKALLTAADPSQPLVLHIHSEGGEVFAGFAMYTDLTQWPGRKIAKIESAAFSIASYLAMACDEIEIADNGYLMIHNPYSMTEGDDEDHARGAATLAQLKSSMVEAYCKRTGMGEDEVKALMKAETYINADDAVRMRFADRVLGEVTPARVFTPTNKMPQLVYASLFGDGGRGEKKEFPKMSESKVSPATVAEIKAAFPKAKADFIVKCLERSLPLASVAAAAAEELMEENAMLQEKCKAMEEELASLKAKASEEEEAAKAKAAEDEEQVKEEEIAKAKAKSKGIQPVAKGSLPAGAAKKSARAEWDGLLAEKVKAGIPRARAVMQLGTERDDLRQAMIAEANER